MQHRHLILGLAAASALAAYKPATPPADTAAPATPELRVSSFDLPERGLVPGDVIAPRIQIANLGAAAVTSDIEVAVMASTEPVPLIARYFGAASGADLAHWL